MFNSKMRKPNRLLLMLIAVFALIFPFVLSNGEVSAAEQATFVAPGGTITQTSTAEEVLAMFGGGSDTTAFSVNKSGSTFHVYFRNCIIELESNVIETIGGVTVNIGIKVEAKVNLFLHGVEGENIIKVKERNFFTTKSVIAFRCVGDSQLSFGTASSTGNERKITYHLNDGTTYVQTPSWVPEFPADLEPSTVTSVTTDSSYRSEHSGTLIIDENCDIPPVSARNGNTSVREIEGYGQNGTTTYGSCVSSDNSTVFVAPGTVLRNFYANNDAIDLIQGAPGIHLTNGSVLQMYGGEIYNMVNVGSVLSSEGGAISVYGGSTRIFIYGGKIYDNDAAYGAAIDVTHITSGGGIYIWGGDIYNNYSYAPGQEEYGTGAIYVFDVPEANPFNISIFDVNMTGNPLKSADQEHSGDICISENAAVNVNLYGGYVERIGVAAGSTHTNVKFAPGSNTNHYWQGELIKEYASIDGETTLYRIEFWNIISVDHDVEVNIRISETDTSAVYLDKTTKGPHFVGDHGYYALLPAGKAYSAVAYSPSMQKNYGIDLVAHPTQRIADQHVRVMHTPVFIYAGEETGSIGFAEAGTGNDNPDGRMFYGWSMKNNVNTVRYWQESPDFENLVGKMYFFVKAEKYSASSGFDTAYSGSYMHDFGLEPASVIAAEGKHIERITSEINAVNIPSNGAYTAYYDFTKTYLGPEHTFDFSSALPVGTELLLIDYTEDGGGVYEAYHYTVESESSSVAVKNFTKMGTSTAVETLDILVLHARAQLSVIFPSGRASGESLSATLSIEQTPQAEVAVNVSDLSNGAVTLSSPTISGNTVSVTASVSGVTSAEADNVLTVELLYGGKVIDIPAGTDFSITGHSGTVLKRRDLMGYIGINDGSYKISLSGLPSGDYSIRVTLCQDTFLTSYPVSEKTALAQKSISIPKATTGVLATTDDDRFIKREAGGTLTFTTDAASVLTQVKENGVYTETTAIAAGAVADGKVTVTVPAGCAVGTYRIVFQKDGAVYNYNIIVYD